MSQVRIDLYAQSRETLILVGECLLGNTTYVKRLMHVQLLHQPNPIIIIVISNLQSNMVINNDGYDGLISLKQAKKSGAKCAVVI